MFTIEKNKSLAPYTTMKIGAAAEFFAVVGSREDLSEAIAWARDHKKPLWVLGGGSNVLIAKKIKGLVIKNEIKGKEIIKQDKDYAFVEAKSGELWSKFVNFTVERGLSGLENLFLIYGTVGAAPIQNIGAYGVELKDSFYHLRAVDLKTGHEKIFARSDCRFGYRDSIFKRRLKNKYFIYSVTMRLKKSPAFNLGYAPLREKLQEKGLTRPEQRDIIDAIQEIRHSKLPNPVVLPNAGSFFKNAFISRAHFRELQKKYPTIPNWPEGRTKMKIPAGWLIEAVGLKGRKFGPVRMYEKQALILVHDGRANVKQILSLVRKVKAAVKRKFAIDLEEEVNII
jgi:UDP-N-acetylmuramate dehydrogenase